MADIKSVAELETELAQAQSDLTAAYAEYDKVEKTDIRAMLVIASKIHNLEGDPEGTENRKRGKIAALEAQIESARFAETVNERKDAQEQAEVVMADALTEAFELGSTKLTVTRGETGFIFNWGGTPAGTRASSGSRAPKSNAAPLPPAGTVLTHKNRDGSTIEAVLDGDGGATVDGTSYPSLSAAAKAVTGQKSINGRKYFGLG